MRLLILTACLCIPACCMAQRDSSSLGKAKINKGFSIRTELGWNKSWFTSLGASYVYSNVNDHAPLSVVVYAAAEANLAGYRSPSVFYGYKAGVETAGMLFGMGMEFRNNTDFSGNDQFVFMPKLGFSIFGYAGLFYGYNVFDKKNNIFNIGHSQLSLNVNISRKLFKDSFVPPH